MKITVSFSIDVEGIEALAGAQSDQEAIDLQFAVPHGGFAAQAEAVPQADSDPMAEALTALDILRQAASTLQANFTSLVDEIESSDDLSSSEKVQAQQELIDALNKANAQVLEKTAEILAMNAPRIKDLIQAAKTSKEASEKALNRLKRIKERLDDITGAIGRVAEVLAFFA